MIHSSVNGVYVLLITSCILLVLFHEGTLTCKLSKFLLLKASDLILADKGFVINDILPKHGFLDIPAFLSGKTKYTKEEAIHSRDLSRCKIHAERASEQLRDYKTRGYITVYLRPRVHETKTSS